MTVDPVQASLESPGRRQHRRRIGRLSAGGVATGATIMAAMDTGVIPWSCALSAMLLLAAAVGLAQRSKQSGGGTRWSGGVHRRRWKRS